MQRNTTIQARKISEHLKILYEYLNDLQNKASKKIFTKEELPLEGDLWWENLAHQCDQLTETLGYIDYLSTHFHKQEAPKIWKQVSESLNKNIYTKNHEYIKREVSDLNDVFRKYFLYSPSTYSYANKVLSKGPLIPQYGEEFFIRGNNDLQKAIASSMQDYQRQFSMEGEPFDVEVIQSNSKKTSKPTQSFGLITKISHFGHKLSRSIFGHAKNNIKDEAREDVVREARTKRFY